MRILRFEGSSSLGASGASEPTAAGCYYSGPEYSRLYTASRKRPVQRMTSSSAQRNGIPNSPRDPETLSLFPCSSNRESGAGALSAAYSSHVPGPTPHEECQTDLGNIVSTGQVQNTSHFKLRWLRVVDWPLGNRKNIHIQGESDPDAQLGEPKVQNKLEVLSTRENERPCHPFSSSEITGSFQLRHFDRLFYATNVQLTMY